MAKKQEEEEAEAAEAAMCQDAFRWASSEAAGEGRRSLGGAGVREYGTWEVSAVTVRRGKKSLQRGGYIAFDVLTIQ